MRMRIAAFVSGLCFAAACSPAASRESVEQYGITWQFDKPHEIGHFVNGDWWVVGPVQIAAMSPPSGPASPEEKATSAKSIYGATALIDDRRLRNGSMIVTAPSGNQGYDSRVISFDASCTRSIPCLLQPGESLISTISNTVEPVETIQTGMKEIAKTQAMALKTAAVLTCVAAPPPADAFRPPYAGRDKPIYETKNIQWSLLPRLAAVPATPKWDWIERMLQRPWLDHIDSWTLQYTGPSDNQPCYGREFSRLDSMASLMLMLDVPQQQKEKLMIELLQIGIDFHGLAMSGREWFADGGHWNGRKWPIIFASLVLNDPSIREFPPMKQEKAYNIHVLSDPDGSRPRTVFSEDMQTYYGSGGDNQSVLWQVCFHTHPRPPLEIKARADFDKTDRWLDGYRQLCSGSYVGAALAARLMNATQAWDHDAFFDYVDRWMRPEEVCTAKIADGGAQSVLRRTPDLFVEQMWIAYRQTAKQSPPAKDQLKWEWVDDAHGHFVENPK